VNNIFFSLIILRSFLKVETAFQKADQTNCKDHMT
jgi:hypothetical protein